MKFSMFLCSWQIVKRKQTVAVQRSQISIIRLFFNRKCLFIQRIFTFLLLFFFSFTSLLRYSTFTSTKKISNQFECTGARLVRRKAYFAEQECINRNSMATLYLLSKISFLAYSTRPGFSFSRRKKTVTNQLKIKIKWYRFYVIDWLF